MKVLRISIFFTSLFISLVCNAQQPNEAIEASIAKDSTAATQAYGLRVGLDISKPIRSLLDDNYKGLALVGDFRITENYYIAAELGNESRTTDLPNINSTSAGSYIKAGFNYNAYNNWYGMNNLIYAGLRAGFSTFNQDLNSYTIYTSDPLFGEDTRTDGQEFKGLNATWLELQIGLQAEVFKNTFVGVNIQLKRRVTDTAPDGFENLYAPGFGKYTDDSSFSAGYGYTITYLLPIFKK